MASKVIKIIYDQSPFHLPEREQKAKFDAGWSNRLSAFDTDFILNANEDMKGQTMFLWLGNHLFLILPEGQIVNLINYYSTFSETGTNYRFYSFLNWTGIWHK